MSVNSSELPSSPKNGYLYKETNGRWRKRFCEVNGSFLAVYDSNKTDKMVAMVDLSLVGEIFVTDPNPTAESHVNRILSPKDSTEDLAMMTGRGSLSRSAGYLINLELLHNTTKVFVLKSLRYEETVFWVELLCKTRDKAKRAFNNGRSAAGFRLDLQSNSEALEDRAVENKENSPVAINNHVNVNYLSDQQQIKDDGDQESPKTELLPNNVTMRLSSHSHQKTRSKKDVLALDHTEMIEVLPEEMLFTPIVSSQNTVNEVDQASKAAFKKGAVFGGVLVGSVMMMILYLAAYLHNNSFHSVISSGTISGQQDVPNKPPPSLHESLYFPTKPHMDRRLSECKQQTVAVTPHSLVLQQYEVLYTKFSAISAKLRSKAEEIHRVLMKSVQNAYGKVIKYFVQQRQFIQTSMTKLKWPFRRDKLAANLTENSDNVRDTVTVVVAN